MAFDRKSLLAEFPQEVVNSHALVVAEIMSGFEPSADTLLELADEVITVDRLTVLMARQIDSIQAAHDCWQHALGCFQSSLDLWDRLPHDDRLIRHGQLLKRLIGSAEERREFYCVNDHDRRIYNSQRDHGMPLPYAET
jgi:hypothetical protein